MKKLLVAVSITIIILVGFLFYRTNTSAPLPATEDAQNIFPETPKAQMMPLNELEVEGIHASYPSRLYKKRIASSSQNLLTSILLIEDTETNRNIIEGKSEIPTEGPTSITIDVFNNSEKLPVGTWYQGVPTWSVHTSPYKKIILGGKEAVEFEWSGLYEGRTIVITQGETAYVFSVTWIDKDDQLIKDFEALLSSLVFSKIEEKNQAQKTQTANLSFTLHQWKWKKTVTGEGNVITPKKDVFVLSFTNHGTFSATTDCNTIGGNYIVSERKIDLENIMSTMMFCEDTQEQEFSGMLQGVNGYVFEKTGELSLLMRGGGQMYFQ